MIPASSYYMGDAIGTDSTYIANFSVPPTNTNPNYWHQDTSYYGTHTWHSNWLDKIKSNSSQYAKLFAWYLMDEPFQTGYRDGATNQYSVWGHSAFCEGVQDDDPKPKMVNVKPSADSTWTALNSNGHTINIICGDDYAYNMTDTDDRYPWQSVNMAKWCFSKVNGSTNQMAMAWLPGYASLDTNTGPTGGTNTCYYTFFGSIIEGARGILWYMTDDAGHSDYSDYGVLKTIYSDFTSNRTFKSSVTNRFSDMNAILSGSNIATNWDTNEDSAYSFSEGYPYPCVLDKKFSAKVFHYSNRYRVFVVNNMSTNASFKIRIDASFSGWSNAYYGTGDDDHRERTYDQVLGFYHLDDTLTGYQYRIYDIGEGNQ